MQIVIPEGGSRELYAAILPDKTSTSARRFPDQVLEEVPYTIEVYSTDNGREYTNLSRISRLHDQVL